MTEIILHRHPNNQYRLKIQNILTPKKKMGDRYAEIKAEKHAREVAAAAKARKEVEDDFDTVFDNKNLRYLTRKEYLARAESLALDIMSESQRDYEGKRRGGWGYLAEKTIFTKRARQQLLSAGAICDRDLKEKGFVVTLTLPGGTDDAIKTLASESGYIINRLVQLLRRKSCKYWFYVWELQTRGALHLHLFLGGLGAKNREVAHLIPSLWWKILEELSIKHEVDLFRRLKGGTWQHTPSKWQADVAIVRKSVSAYFAKYACKPCEKSVMKLATGGRLYCPSRWWGCSSHLKAQIKLATKEYRLTTTDNLAVEAQELLRSWLDQPGLRKSYSSIFQLKRKDNGMNLGWGEVDINYYDDATFENMQTSEKETWDFVTQICGLSPNADMNADMRYADMNTRISQPSLSPPSQPSEISRKLRMSRGTQAEPSLDIRARLIQSLAGGKGTATSPKIRTTALANADMEKANADIDTQTWMQPRLFG
jgi:hypothetical protein